MRQKMLRSKTLTGIVLAVAAGCFWGTMAVSGQYMITACGFNAEELTTVRIAGTGILMLVLGMLTHPVFKGKQGKIFTQLSGSCTYAKILRRNNKAFIRDRESVLVWKTPIGSFVLALDLTANGINGVYVDAEENYSLKEEVLFFRWVEESGRLLP